MHFLAKETDNKTSDPEKTSAEDEKVTPLDIPIVDPSGDEKDKSMLFIVIS